MFDIGFSEIVVIGVVALVVIGPEKLPKTARTLGHLFGRLQRYVNEVKSDINREMELDELRQIQKDVKTAAEDLKQSVQSAAQDFESSAKEISAEINATAGTATGAVNTAANEVQSAVTAVPGAVPPSAPDLPALAGDAIPAVTAAARGEPKPPAAEPPRQAALPGFDTI
jgi:sec-independent protein translocase protein TatB